MNVHHEGGTCHGWNEEFRGKPTEGQPFVEEVRKVTGAQELMGKIQGAGFGDFGKRFLVYSLAQEKNKPFS